MSEQSAKPYLVRAISEWCADNGLTPYLAVRVNAQTKVDAQRLYDAFVRVLTTPRDEAAAARVTDEL